MNLNGHKKDLPIIKYTLMKGGRIHVSVTDSKTYHYGEILK